MMAFLVEELGSQAAQVLGVFGDFVGLSRGALAKALVMVESVAEDGRSAWLKGSLRSCARTIPLPILLLPSLDVSAGKSAPVQAL